MLYDDGRVVQSPKEQRFLTQTQSTRPSTMVSTFSRILGQSNINMKGLLYTLLAQWDHTMSMKQLMDIQLLTSRLFLIATLLSLPMATWFTTQPKFKIGLDHILLIYQLKEHFSQEKQHPFCMCRSIKIINLLLTPTPSSPVLKF